MQIKSYLGATALLSVLAAPAFGQTVNQFTNTLSFSPLTAIFSPSLYYTNGFLSNTVDVNVAGTLAEAEAVQIANINTNIYAPATNSSTTFSINQGAGVYSRSGVARYGEFDQTIQNTINAESTSPFLSNATAGGTQIGSIRVNDVNFTANDAGATGRISQQAGTDGVIILFPGFLDTALTIENSMTARVLNGDATVEGTLDAVQQGAGAVPMNIDPGQYAIVSINTATIGLGAGAVNLRGAAVTGESGVYKDGFTQSLIANNSISATNLALANSISSTDAALDPTIRNLAQQSAVTLNSLSLTTPQLTDSVGEFGELDFESTTYAQGTINIVGSQNGTPADPVNGFSLTNYTFVRLGNTAAAFTGAEDTFFGVQDPARYNVGTGALGNGISIVNNVDQVAQFSLNTISNPVEQGATGGVNLNLAGSNTAPYILKDPEGDDIPANRQYTFTQMIDGASLAIAVPGEILPGGTVNLIVSRTNTGSSSIVDSSQTYISQINSVAVGGTLSGGLLQDAVSFDGGRYDFTNFAVAEAEVGPATINGLTQQMSQSLNSVSAGTIGDLYLVQNADFVNMTNTNRIEAVGTTASITGGVQINSLNVNTIRAADMNLTGGNITQQFNTNNSEQLMLNAVNTQTASSAPGRTASISGAIQVSSLNVNTITGMTGSMDLGTGTINQLSSGVNLSATNTLTALGYNASITGAIQQGAINVNVITK